MLADTHIVAGTGMNQGTHENAERDREYLASLRVAIVHYWFVSMGGGERVVEEIGKIFPQADLFALIAVPEHIPASLSNRKLTTSYLQKIPFVHRFHRHTLFLQPLALEQFDLSQYDLILSSDSGPAKGVLTSANALHICYCHSPMRYIWDMYAQYAKSMSLFTRLIFALTAHRFRIWDRASADRVDSFVTNSLFSAVRIRKYYRREALVIYPPVNVESAEINADPEDYYLAVGRLVGYKRFDLAVEACTRLNRRLKIVGSGPEYKSLKKMAGPTVEFLGKVSDAEMYQAFSKCRALLFPGEEDFGIVPVEAQAHGRPVIAYGRGGALETVCNLADSDFSSQAPTGILFEEQSVDALVDAILTLESNPNAFDPERIRAHAMEFDSSVFRDKLTKHILESQKNGSEKQWNGKPAQGTSD